MQVKLFSLVNFETSVASMRTACYMQHLINYSTVSTKQNNTLRVAQQTTYKNVFSMTWFIPNWGLGLSCFSNVWKIKGFRNAILNVFMHIKHTCICAYQKGGKHLLMSDWINCVFLFERYYFSKKKLAVCILAEVSAYWRSKIETSTKNSLNYEVLANYANN